MHKMTEQNMINAFGGESQAHMRYTYFASQAQKENFPNTARLFEAISFAETVHAWDHYLVLKHLNGGFVANSMAAFGPGNTLKNLELAIDGETFEIEEMYPAYIEIAKLQDEKGAQRSFEWSYKTEKEHLKLFTRALTALQGGLEAPLAPIQVCSVCGYTIEGEAPDTCPLCKALKNKFVSFIEKKGMEK
jgi:rubrerythrin